MAKRFVIFFELNMLRRANIQELVFLGLTLFRRNYITTGQNNSVCTGDSKELAVEVHDQLFFLGIVSRPRDCNFTTLVVKNFVTI